MKLSTLIKKLQKLEEKHGGDVPVMINFIHWDSSCGFYGRNYYPLSISMSKPKTEPTIKIQCHEEYHARHTR